MRSKYPSFMPTTEEHDYVSTVFTHFLQPIADLCDRMLELCSGEPNEVQTSPMENGYAISIIALTAFLLGGACGRTRYISAQKQCSPAGAFRAFGEDGIAEKIGAKFV